jgi:hypothetical protein
MTQREWMVVAERLMNLMESFDYKSEQYNVCRKVLLAHLAKKPDHDEEEGHAWTMTGPAPFEAETPLPARLLPKRQLRQSRRILRYRLALSRNGYAKNAHRAQSSRVKKLAP